MTPKEAISVARDYVTELFASEGARNIGLEELRFDPETDRWIVTIGFTRGWDGPQGILGRIDEREARWPRTFKTVEIDDRDGRVIELEALAGRGVTGALIDANLLCLLVVGRIDRSAISSHPRLKAFDADDFGLLGAVIDRVGEPILCPHVLTEASNLLAFRQSTTQIATWLASLADLVGRFAEHSEAATTTAIGDRAYLRLGLTDAMLLVLAADQALTLVSNDLALCLEAARRGATTINYNNIRDGALRLADI